MYNFGTLAYLDDKDSATSSPSRQATNIVENNSPLQCLTGNKLKSHLLSTEHC